MMPRKEYVDEMNILNRDTINSVDVI